MTLKGADRPRAVHDTHRIGGAVSLRAIRTMVATTILAACACATAPAHAQDAPSQEVGDWTFQLAPYMWGAGQTGTVRVGNLQNVEVNAHFSDVLKHLKFGAMTAFEARRGPWAILADGFYVKVGTTSDPLLGGYLGTARLGGETTILQLAGAYRVTEDSKVALDVLAGVRYTNLSSKLDLSQSALLPNGAHASTHYDWTDGLVGLRVLYRIDPAWTLMGYVDVGAGGTKFSWQAVAGAKYSMTNSTDLAFGYRSLSQDYSSTGFHYNVRTAGPYLGVIFRF